MTNGCTETEAGTVGEAVGHRLDRGVRRLPGPLRLRVNSHRNSYCAMPVGWLDWSRWFTDGTGGELYLHVYGPDDSIQRVYCRRSTRPRLEFMEGQLWWLVDRAPNAEVTGLGRATEVR